MRNGHSHFIAGNPPPRNALSNLYNVSCAIGACDRGVSILLNDEAIELDVFVDGVERNGDVLDEDLARTRFGDRTCAELKRRALGGENEGLLCRHA
jgi:hypothetical protein